MSTCGHETRCGHNSYWTGIYGTCMACAREKAEAEVERLRAENAELTAHVAHWQMRAGEWGEEGDKLRAELETSRNANDTLRHTANTSIDENYALRAENAELRRVKEAAEAWAPVFNYGDVARMILDGTGPTP